VKCLLIAPNPDSALNPEAGSLLQEVSFLLSFLFWFLSKKKKSLFVSTDSFTLDLEIRIINPIIKPRFSGLQFMQTKSHQFSQMMKNLWIKL